MHSSPQISALFDNASMGIVVTNDKGIIHSINPFALKLFGYTIAEINDKPIEMLIPERYYKNHLQDRKDYMVNPKNRPMGVGMDLYAIKKDGNEFPVEVSLGYYQSNGDQNVIAFINDITVRKQAEQEITKLNDDLEAIVEQRTKDLKETLYKLELSTEKLEDVLSYQKALLDNAGAMIIATDEKGIIKLFNPEAANETGYKESEVLHKSTPLLFHDKSDIARKREELLNEFGKIIPGDFAVLVEKAWRNIHEEEQYRYIRKNGQSFPVSLTITSIKDKKGELTGFMGIAIDISARIKAEEDLQKALEKERVLSELKSGFVTMASHEFRTPLSTILSSAYLIEKYTNTDDQLKREKHLQRIISSVNMLTDILNDFLSVGKIEEGKIQVRPSEFNIQQQVLKIADEIRDTLKKQQDLLCVHDGEPDVIMDPSLLKHIVMNLVSNAGKFSPEKSVIEIKTSCQDHTIKLSVKDYGMGISTEDQKHLMERFFRGANAGNIQGTGLGLHIVSKYAELMNGTVECKSELEKGTEFVVMFNTKANCNEKNFTD